MLQRHPLRLPETLWIRSLDTIRAKSSGVAATEPRNVRDTPWIDESVFICGEPGRNRIIAPGVPGTAFAQTHRAECQAFERTVSGEGSERISTTGWLKATGGAGFQP